MIRLEAIQTFNLKDFNKIKDIKRKGANIDGRIFVGDSFICDKEMAEYLTGKNDIKLVACKVVEVIPEVKEEKKVKATKKTK